MKRLATVLAAFLALTVAAFGQSNPIIVPTTGAVPPATPAGIQQLINGTPWINGVQGIGGRNWRDNYQLIHDTLAGMGTWNAQGVFSLNPLAFPPVIGDVVCTSTTANEICKLASIGNLSGLLKGNGTQPISAAGTSDVVSALGFAPFNRAGDTMTGALLAQNPSGTPSLTDIHTISPANGAFINPYGTWLDYCSVTGCFAGPHLLAGSLFASTTHADASAQESTVSINFTSNTGKAVAWAASTNYAAGDQVHGPTVDNIYQAGAACTSGATGPSQTSGTSSDGSCTWTYIGPGLNDGKEGLSIAGVAGPNTGHFWTMDSAFTAQQGSGGASIIGYEQDSQNGDNVDRVLGKPLMVGIFQFGSGMVAPGTAARYVGMGGTVATSAWHYGDLFSGDNLVKDATIADATSSNVAFYALGAPHVHQVTFQDDTNSTRSMLIKGSHTYGIDMTQGTFGTAILLPPSNYIGFNGQAQNLGYNANSGCLTYGPTNSGTLYSFQSCNNGNFGIAGHLASRGASPTLSGCPGATLQAGSTDLSGTIIEGSSCTGATLTFAQANANADPFCVVMPWNGSATPLTAYNGAANSFAYAHASASGQKFTYHCMSQ